jgi:hypothetical protein
MSEAAKTEPNDHPDEEKKPTNRPKLTLSEDSDLNDVLRGLPIGWKVSVTRKKPKWAAGHLDTCELDPGEGLDLDDLRDTWGGGTYELRILDPQGYYRGKKSLQFQGAPRLDGQTIAQNTGPAAAPPPPPPPPAPHTDPALLDLLKQANANAAAAQTQMITFLSARLIDMEARIMQMQKAPTAAAPAKDPIDTIRDTAEAFRALQELSGSITPPEGAAAPILGPELQKVLGSALQGWLERQQPQPIITHQPPQPRPPRPPLPERAPPPPQAGPPRRATAQQPHAAAPPPVQPPTAQNPAQGGSEDFQAQLARELAALAQAPLEVRAQILDQIIAQVDPLGEIFGGDLEEDEQDDEQEDDDQDDEQDDEQEENGDLLNDEAPEKPADPPPAPGHPID